LIHVDLSVRVCAASNDAKDEKNVEVPDHDLGDFLGGDDAKVARQLMPDSMK